MADLKLKCVILGGELEYLGKHILMPQEITLCGVPTIYVDTKTFPVLKEKNLADFRSEYSIVEWDITCERCLDILDILKEKREHDKTK